MSFKNFLLAHYEKLILVVLLIICGVLLYLQFGIVQKGRLEEVERIIGRKEPKTDYQTIDRKAENFQLQTVFSDSLKLNFNAPAEKSTVTELMTPYPMAECIHCHALIHASNIPPIGAAKSGKCPVCGKEIKPKEKNRDGGGGIDVNGNGIPDEWEKKFKLREIVAESDEDEDGFTLEQEWRADTDPTDPKKHPLYVTETYVYRVAKKTIPILQLKSVNNSGTDKQKWDVAFTVRKKRSTRNTTANVRLNQGTFENQGVSYKVVDIVEDKASSNPIVYIQEVDAEGTEQKLECKIKQPVTEPDIRVSLDELVHKIRKTVMVGKNIILGTDATGKEEYKLVSANPETKTAVLESTGADKKQYTIPEKPAKADDVVEDTAGKPYAPPKTQNADKPYAPPKAAARGR